MDIESSSPWLLSGNVFELFDPLKQSNRPHSWPSNLNEAGTKTNTIPFVTATAETLTIPSLSYPYPIKLRLKSAMFPEIKSFSQLIQQIRHENETKQVLEIKKKNNNNSVMENN